MPEFLNTRRLRGLKILGGSEHGARIGQLSVHRRTLAHDVASHFDDDGLIV
jgi:hypothetical protein